MSNGPSIIHVVLWVHLGNPACSASQAAWLDLRGVKDATVDPKNCCAQILMVCLDAVPRACPHLVSGLTAPVQGLFFKRLMGSKLSGWLNVAVSPNVGKRSVGAEKTMNEDTRNPSRSPGSELRRNTNEETYYQPTYNLTDPCSSGYNLDRSYSSNIRTFLAIMLFPGACMSGSWPIVQTQITMQRAVTLVHNTPDGKHLLFKNLASASKIADTHGKGIWFSRSHNNIQGQLRAVCPSCVPADLSSEASLDEPIASAIDNTRAPRIDEILG
ncbi:hypothetical protein IWZ03DRAFT_381459 [Phyllosticta citriasiana]|uniref:Uncharacterized protein n=1 Tax=Phyllosticta citriasiana TaxID=595635 RepID=A0ABR1KH05_9PEZI